jgi:hypothetical protein
LIMRTIYLSTLNWADKEFFLTFLYIASVGQAWQNPSNTNPRVGLRALINPTRSDINPRVGFELLSETQFYGQANHAQTLNERTEKWAENFRRKFYWMINKEIHFVILTSRSENDIKTTNKRIEIDIEFLYLVNRKIQINLDVS